MRKWYNLCNYDAMTIQLVFKLIRLKVDAIDGSSKVNCNHWSIFYYFEAYQRGALKIEAVTQGYSVKKVFLKVS